MKRLFLILDIVLYCVLYVLSIYLSKLLILIAVSAKTAFEFLENRMLLRGGDFSEAVTEVFSKQTLPALLLSYLLFFLLCYITFKIKKKDLTGYAGYGGARFSVLSAPRSRGRYEPFDLRHNERVYFA